MLLILKPDGVLPNHGSGVSGPLILQIAAVSSILIHIYLLLYHLAFSLDFDDALIVSDIGASHLSHPAEDIVECAHCCCGRCILQHHFEL